MRRKDREISDEKKIDEIILESRICRLGFNDNGEVYIVPMNFGFKNECGRRTFYFHSAREGRKVDLVKTKPNVCFELDTAFVLKEGVSACEYTASYRSVMGKGIIEMVEDETEKEEALIEIMHTLTGKREWLFDERIKKKVAIFKLTVESISCKEHE